MINNIQFSREDDYKNIFNISWDCNSIRNEMTGVYKEYAYVIIYKLLDAQIGSRDITKQQVVKYIKTRK